MQIADLSVESFRQETQSDATLEKRFGFLVLSNDLGIERELQRLIPPDIHAHVTRIRSYVDVGMADSISSIHEAVSLLAPHQRLDGIAYGCTSGSFLTNDGALVGAVGEVRPGVPLHTPRSATISAIRHLGLRRVALLTPYEDELGSAIATQMGEKGVDIARVGSFYCASDFEIARLSSEQIARAAEHLLADEDVEGVVIACNALECSPVIDGIERRTGKMVVTSTQAMVWRLLRTSGYVRPSYGHGKLLRT